VVHVDDVDGLDRRVGVGVRRAFGNRSIACSRNSMPFICGIR
jgi:hypothetical protein